MELELALELELKLELDKPISTLELNSELGPELDKKSGPISEIELDLGLALMNCDMSCALTDGTAEGFMRLL